MTLSSSYLYEDGLISERLRSRFLQPADAQVWSQFMNNREATALFPERVFPPGEDASALWIQNQIKRYHNFQYGLQAIEDRKTGAFVGQCGLLLQEVDGVAELEVGYHFLPTYWGKGFAPEAAALFMKYATDNRLSDTIISIIDVRNAKSQRVADKNGLKREKQTTWRDLQVFVYRKKLS
jgi:RimJ/RimL family protein N-acetyltransferase